MYLNSIGADFDHSSLVNIIQEKSNRANLTIMTNPWLAFTQWIILLLGLACIFK